MGLVDILAILAKSYFLDQAIIAENRPCPLYKFIKFIGLGSVLGSPRVVLSTNGYFYLIKTQNVDSNSSNTKLIAKTVY